MENRVKRLYLLSPYLLGAKDAKRLLLDNKLRFEYELANPKSAYRAIGIENLYPESRGRTSFMYKVPFKFKKKRQYIIRLLCYNSRCHTKNKSNVSGSLFAELNYRIKQDAKYLSRMENKYPDVSEILTVKDASRIWWNG